MPALDDKTELLWVSVPKAAHALDLDPRTVRKLAADGKLRSRNDLGQMRIWWPDVLGEDSHSIRCISDFANGAAA